MEPKEFNQRQKDDLLELFVKAYRDKELARRTVDLVEYMWLDQHKGNWREVAYKFSSAGLSFSEVLLLEAVVKDLWTYEIQGLRCAESFQSYAAASEACDKVCQESKVRVACKIVRPFKN